MKLWLPFLILVSLGFEPSRASAHAVSNSYLELTQTAERVSGRWRVAAIDLDAAIGLDQDADGRVNDAEVSERRPALESYLLSRVELSNAERACPLLPSALTTSGRFVVLELASDCTGARSLRYDLFFEHDRSHQAYLHVAGDSELDHVFTSTRRSIALAATTTATAWLQYLGQGIHHILIGADHILFLLTLLLAAVLRREAGRQQPVSNLRGAFVGVAQIVTAFTVAHSITLSLMTLGLVAPSPRWVETAIALSIVAAAANNVWPLITRRLWLVAFGFGLIHGLGFAGVLLELGLPRGQRLIAVVGFNLGVEVGQLAIVGVAFPLALWLRTRQSYRRVALGFSLSIGAIGLLWSLERALDASWTSRWASLVEGPAAGGPSAGTRPCPGLPALASPALHAAVLATANDDASTLAGRRAYELACAGQLEPRPRLTPRRWRRPPRRLRPWALSHGPMPKSRRHAANGGTPSSCSHARRASGVHRGPISPSPTRWRASASSWRERSSGRTCFASTTRPGRCTKSGRHGGAGQRSLAARGCARVRGGHGGGEALV